MLNSNNQCKQTLRRRKQSKRINNAHKQRQASKQASRCWSSTVGSEMKTTKEALDIYKKTRPPKECEQTKKQLTKQTNNAIKHQENKHTNNANKE